MWKVPDNVQEVQIEGSKIFYRIKADKTDKNRMHFFEKEWDDMIFVKRPHVALTSEDKCILKKEGNSKYLTKSIQNITFSNIEGHPEKIKYFIEYLYRKNNKKISVAEIGVKFGSTAFETLNLLNDFISEYHGYEIDEARCELISERLEDFKNFKLIAGDAAVTMPQNNFEYDFVFFDASHHYNNDMPILKELKNHLTKDSIIFIDDFDIPDVKRCIEEFVQDGLYRVIF